MSRTLTDIPVVTSQQLMTGERAELKSQLEWAVQKFIKETQFSDVWDDDGVTVPDIEVSR